MIDLKAKLEPALVANVARAEPYAWDGECRHLRRSMSVCSSRLGHQSRVKHEPEHSGKPRAPESR